MGKRRVKLKKTGKLQKLQLVYMLRGDETEYGEEWKFTDTVITVWKIIGRKCGCCSLDGMRSACPTSHTHYMLRGPRETVDWRQHGQGLSESLQEGERGGTL